MRSRSAAHLIGAAALLLAQAHAQQPAPQQPAPSEAEQLVFLHDHLASSRSPRSLHYRYVEETPGKPPVSDRAVLTLSQDAGGHCCDVHGDYLSGALAVRIPDIPDAQANPVLLYFLEGEVRRLQRTTGGQQSHFRRQFRQALVDSATVTDTTVPWRGQPVAAKAVRVAPFLTDPYRARFADQATTEYAFVLSDAVPGGVYQMSATVPGETAGAAVRAHRTLTIEETPP